MNSIRSIQEIATKTVASIEEVDHHYMDLYAFVIVFTDGTCLRLNVESQCLGHAWIKAELNSTHGK